MKRRSNKSTKVPNVKLRPAEKGAYSHPVVESCWAEDSQESPAADDSRAAVDTCPRPLVNVVICATGISDKPTLFKQAVELGATCTLAFTDRVTHLIAVDHGGAKYMCALERKIPIVRPSWITENYQIWLKGDDVDVDQSVATHRLPIFSGVIVCPSGITDITRRTQIAKLIAAHDGAYLKNLERPVRVTHLLCAGDAETDKMRYADKFNARGEARIQLVWEEWFWDCLDFGGRFEEEGYEVRRPRPERRREREGVQPAGPPPSSSLPSRFDEGPSSSAPKAGPVQHRPPPPAVVENDMEEEPAFARVLPNVTLQLWGNLLGRRGYQVTDGEIILSPSKDKPASSPHAHTSRSRSPSPQHADRPGKEGQAFGAARSVIANASFRRANSFAPQETSTARQGAMPFRRSATVGGIFNANANNNGGAVAGPSRLRGAAPDPLPVQEKNRNTGPAQTHAEGPAKTKPTNPAADPSAHQDPPQQQPQIFAGLRIRPMGEARGPAVRSAIEARGGVVVGGDAAEDGYEEVDYVVVRLVSGSKLFLDEDSPAQRAKYRTECWLEQCLYEDRLCAATEHVAYVPLGVRTPVPGAEGVVFSFSGFGEGAGHALRRLGRALGITLAPTFNKRATHLLCPSGTGLKFDKACEWGVPVVNMGWLEEMARTGRVPGVQGFLVEGPTGAGAAVDEVDGPPPVGRALDKGKGRAVAVAEAEQVGANGKRIVDITNDVPPHAEPPAGKKPKQLKSLGREATTIVPDAQQQQGGGGGSRASMLQRNRTGSTFDQSGYYVHPSSIPTQSRPPSVPPPAGCAYGEGEEEEPQTPSHEMFVPDRSFGLHGVLPPQQLPLQHPQQPQQQQESQSQIEAEKSNPHFRIPSSKSPSPMKLRTPVIPAAAPGAGPGQAQANQARPMRRVNSRGMSLSPVKIDHEAAKALQESITSLLGKRPSPETAAGAVGDEAAPGVGRGAKRARPQRSKAQSRQVSDANIDVGAPTGGAGAGVKGKGTVGGKAVAEYASISAISAFESYEEHGHGVHGAGRSMEVEEESMRVLYEDPGQRREKQRLMDMLKSQNGGAVGEEDSIVSGSAGSAPSGSGSGSGSYTRKSTRRSTRIAG